jgi:ABC-2 type transport system permease protein
MSQVPQTSTPIADLSYRNYGGPLESPRFRWWVIAKQGMRLALKKKSLYWLMAVAGWYYAVMIIVLFFLEQIAAGNPQGKQATQVFVDRLIWKDQFLHGYSFSQLILLIIALLLGAGSIANDNRANALLVYLSKPCSKFDYMFGKWIGIFLPLLAIMTVPTLVFYGYGALSFRDYGFLKDDPYLLPKMLMVLPLSAMLHSSIVLGVSSLFNQGRVAGATYAGIYFLTNFFTKLMQVAWFTSRGEAPEIVKNLFYFSIDGLQIGMAKAILGTSGSPPFGAQVPSRAAPIGPPNLAIVLPIVFAITALSLLLAWRRVRAVEVVG